MSAPTPTQWAHLPPLPTLTKDPMPRLFVEVGALLVAVIGPLAYALSDADAGGVEILALTMVATVVAALLPERWWPLRLAVAAAAGWVAISLTGVEALGLWLAVGLGLADWVVRGRRPLPFVPAPPSTTILPVAVVLAVAALRITHVGFTVGPFILLGIAVAISTASSWWGHRLDSVAKGVGHAAGHAVGYVCFWLLGLIVVVLPWLGHRLMRVDPVAWPTIGGTDWVRLAHRDVAARDPWAKEAAFVPSNPWRRVRRMASVPIVLVVFAGALYVVKPSFGGSSAGVPDGQTDGMIAVAHEGEEWYPEYQADIDWVINDSDVWRPLRLYRVADVKTAYVNVIDGARVTWTPPACDCERLSVWVYGGSTTFGLGQRDEHTISSELARAAWDEGIALDVTNRGIPGQLHWEEAQRFAWDLTVEDPPDLVVFYDGVNEIWLVQQLRTERDRLVPIDPLVEDIWPQVIESRPTERAEPPNSEVLDMGTYLEGEPPDVLGEDAAVLYDRSRKLSRDTAAANDIPVAWFWQPSRMSRDPRPDEPINPPASEAWRKALYRGAETNVPDGVIDLTDVFDDVDAPLFSDEVHHNELGATIVAEAMLEDLRPQIDRILAERGVES